MMPIRRGSIPGQAAETSAPNASGSVSPIARGRRSPPPSPPIADGPEGTCRGVPHVDHQRGHAGGVERGDVIQPGPSGIRPHCHARSPRPGPGRLGLAES